MPGKVLVNLATGLEDAEREAAGTVCEGCLPIERLFAQFEEGGGELWLCPICWNSRGLAESEAVPNAKIAGATPVWEWIGDDTTVFSY